MVKGTVQVSYAEAVDVLQIITKQLIGKLVLTEVVAVVGTKPLPARVIAGCRE